MSLEPGSDYAGSVPRRAVLTVVGLAMASITLLAGGILDDAQPVAGPSRSPTRHETRSENAGYGRGQFGFGGYGDEIPR